MMQGNFHIGNTGDSSVSESSAKAGPSNTQSPGTTPAAGSELSTQSGVDSSIAAKGKQDVEQGKIDPNAVVKGPSGETSGSPLNTGSGVAKTSSGTTEDEEAKRSLGSRFRAEEKDKSGDKGTVTPNGSVSLQGVKTAPEVVAKHSSGDRFKNAWDTINERIGVKVGNLSFHTEYLAWKALTLTGAVIASAATAPFVAGMVAKPLSWLGTEGWVNAALQVGPRMGMAVGIVAAAVAFKFGFKKIKLDYDDRIAGALNLRKQSFSDPWDMIDHIKGVRNFIAVKLGFTPEQMRALDRISEGKKFGKKLADEYQPGVFKLVEGIPDAVITAEEKKSLKAFLCTDQNAYSTSWLANLKDRRAIAEDKQFNGLTTANEFNRIMTKLESDRTAGSGAREFAKKLYELLGEHDAAMAPLRDSISNEQDRLRYAIRYLLEKGKAPQAEMPVDPVKDREKADKFEDFFGKRDEKGDLIKDSSGRIVKAGYMEEQKARDRDAKENGNYNPYGEPTGFLGKLFGRRPYTSAPFNPYRWKMVEFDLAQRLEMFCVAVKNMQTIVNLYPAEGAMAQANIKNMVISELNGVELGAIEKRLGDDVIIVPPFQEQLRKRCNLFWSGAEAIVDFGKRHPVATTAVLGFGSLVVAAAASKAAYGNYAAWQAMESGMSGKLLHLGMDLMQTLRGWIGM